MFLDNSIYWNKSDLLAETLHLVTLDIFTPYLHVRPALVTRYSGL